MKSLIPIEFNNQRIMTTKILAEAYGTDEKNIQMNFSNNRERFTEGKHYFRLEKEALKDFKESLPNNIREDLKYVPILYLWTDEGAARHAKILDTSEAWEVYAKLEEVYFRTKNDDICLRQLSPELQMFNQLFKTVARQELENRQIKQALADTKQEVQTIRDTVVVVPDNWRTYCVETLRKIAFKNSLQYEQVNKMSYEALQERAGCDLQRRLKGRKERAEKLGIAKSKISRFNYLDCIEDDKKLVNIFLIIVKEMAIKYKIA